MGRTTRRKRPLTAAELRALGVPEEDVETLVRNFDPSAIHTHSAPLRNVRVTSPAPVRLEGETYRQLVRRSFQLAA